MENFRNLTLTYKLKCAGYSQIPLKGWVFSAWTTMNYQSIGLLQTIKKVTAKLVCIWNLVCIFRVFFRYTADIFDHVYDWPSLTSAGFSLCCLRTAGSGSRYSSESYPASWISIDAPSCSEEKNIDNILYRIHTKSLAYSCVFLATIILWCNVVLKEGIT